MYLENSKYISGHKEKKKRRNGVDTTGGVKALQHNSGVIAVDGTLVLSSEKKGDSSIDNSNTFNKFIKFLFAILT